MPFRMASSFHIFLYCHPLLAPLLGKPHRALVCVCAYVCALLGDAGTLRVRRHEAEVSGGGRS